MNDVKSMKEIVETLLFLDLLFLLSFLFLQLDWFHNTCNLLPFH